MADDGRLHLRGGITIPLFAWQHERGQVSQAEHHEKDVVSGRVIEVVGRQAQVELGEGIRGACKLPAQAEAEEKKASAAKADLSSLSSMLQNRWKGGESSTKSKPEALQSGQIRSFRITKLDREAKKIELELAP